MPTYVITGKVGPLEAVVNAEGSTAQTKDLVAYLKEGLRDRNPEVGSGIALQRTYTVDELLAAHTYWCRVLSAWRDLGLRNIASQYAGYAGSLDALIAKRQQERTYN